MAAPNPEQELRRLKKLLQSGLPSLLLVYGESDFFRGEAMDCVMAAVPQAAELRSMEGAALRDVAEANEEDEPDDDSGESTGSCPELQDLRGGGLFAQSTVLVVRRAKVWWKRNVVVLSQQRGSFAKGSALVLEATALDRRKKVAAALVKQCAEAGASFEFRDLYEQPYNRSDGLAAGELVQWLIGRSKQLGVALSDESACLFVTQVGGQPRELRDELERLQARLGADAKRAPLRPADLRGHLTVSFESTPFEFVEAMLDRDRPRTLRSLHAMFARGVRDKAGKAMDSAGLLPFTTSWLFRALTKLYGACQAVAQGAAARDAASNAGVQRFQEQFLAQIKKNSVEQIERGLLALQHCQRLARSSGEDGLLLLDRLVAQWFDEAPLALGEDLS